MSRAKTAKAGRSDAGAESASAATASGSDIPARTDAISRSHTSGQRPRRVRRNRVRRDRSQATGAKAAATPATTASAATWVISHASAPATRAHSPPTATTLVGATRARPAPSSNEDTPPVTAAGGFGRSGQTQGEIASRMPAARVAPQIQVTATHPRRDTASSPRCRRRPRRWGRRSPPRDAGRQALDGSAPRGAPTRPRPAG